MPSKSKSQRAFLIRVVADEDYAKSRKMSQEVARGILEEDEEHIKKDSHWADKLPDRANSSSNEARYFGDAWYNPEYIPLLVEQQVHPSFESFSQALKDTFRFMLGKQASGPTKTTQSAAEYNATKWVAPAHWDAVSTKPDQLRTVKSGTGDVSGFINSLHVKGSIGQPFWPSLIRKVDEYTTTLRKTQKSIVDYCNKCKAIYKKCESMQPQAALEYATAEMKKLGLNGPVKPAFPMADFNITVGPRGGTEWHRISGTPNTFVVPYPTQEQFDKIKAQATKLWIDNGEDEWWTLDDADELKWWDHHFPDQSQYWGPLLDLFPYAGEIRGVDTEALSWSHDTVTQTLMRLLMAISDPKAQ